jgi:RHS repeat-associated protein
VNTTDKVEYLYDAMGNKLAKLQNIAGVTPTIEYYYGDVVLTKIYPSTEWKLGYVITPEGRVTTASNSLTGSPTYEYHLKDHLGNTRVAYIAGTDGAAVVKQQADYYPFGLQIASASYTSGENKYLYNGKELQDNTLGGTDLDWYDYGARMYDPQLGRFHTQDAFAEKYSSLTPYQYGANNPIKYIDVNGDSTFLMIWATANGNIGHAALAVSNYKTEVVKDKDGNVVVDKNGNPVTKQVEDGTYTVYQLGPAPPGVGPGNINEDVDAVYSGSENGTVTRDQLFNSDVSTCHEDRPADGIVGLGTDYRTDKQVKYTMNYIKGYDQDYNGVSNNCSDYAQAGLRTASGTRITADERILGHNVTTPNQLFKQTRGLQNSVVLRNPGNAINNSFIQGYIFHK